MINNDYFVEIDGRIVPTTKQLRKTGLMTIGGGILTTKTKVTDDDYRLTPEQLRTIVWNLMKYSSFTFLERLIEFLKIIERNYEKAISVFSNVRDIDIENLKYLNDAIHIGGTGKKLILSNKKEAGYKHFRGINGICVFQQGFRGRKADEYSWEWLGAGNGPDCKSKGLFLWIEKAIEMAHALHKGGTWSWPSIITYEWLKFPVPPSFNYVQETRNVILKTGHTIPVTGIWNPVDFKSGCPSFLLAGDEFPNTEIATERLEDPEFFDEESGLLNKSWIDFKYTEHPSRWELLWEDNRYIDGTIPEEEKEYLDESCSFPNEPPEPVKK